MEPVDERGGIVVRHGFDHGHWASWRFGAARGEMRATFGLHIARIATQNGLDVEDDLARILPASGVEDDGDSGRKDDRKKRGGPTTEAP